MSKARLTRDELDEIGILESDIKQLLEDIEKAKRFNVGDYLIRFCGDSKEPEMNSYHIARRFLVIHTDINGIPYIKEVMGGKISSQLMAMSSIDGAREYANNIRNGYARYLHRYELDPLYEDHILMSQEGEYNPALEQLSKSKLHKEITDFNKSIKISIESSAGVVKFVRNVKVGDTFWFSNVTSFLVQEVKPLPKGSGSSYAFYANNSLDEIIVGTTNKGKKLRLNMMKLYNKAIYTSCPRSYKELKT